MSRVSSFRLVFTSLKLDFVLSRAPLAGLIVMSAQTGRAQFTGDYAVTPPAPALYEHVGEIRQFGQWFAHSGAGSPGLDTTQAPQSVGLIGASCCRPDNLDFNTFAPAPGTVTFSYTIDGTNEGRFNWFHGGTRKIGTTLVNVPLIEGPTITNASQAASTVSFNVEEGEEFGFNVRASGNSVIFPVPISVIATRLVTIFDFHGPASTAPGPLLEQLTRDGDNLRFQFQAEPAHAYTVEYNEENLSTQWLSLTNFSTKTLSTAIIVDKIHGDDSRFYRVRGEPIR